MNHSGIRILTVTKLVIHIELQPGETIHLQTHRRYHELICVLQEGREKFEQYKCLNNE